MKYILTNIKNNTGSEIKGDILKCCDYQKKLIENYLEIYGMNFDEFFIKKSN